MLTGVSLDIESMVTPVFATLIFDDIIGLLKSIRRLNRATMSSAPDELRKIIRLQMSHSDIQVLQQAGRPFVSSMISIRKTR